MQPTISELEHANEWHNSAVPGFEPPSRAVSFNANVVLSTKLAEHDLQRKAASGSQDCSARGRSHKVMVPSPHFFRYFVGDVRGDCAKTSFSSAESSPC